jgi:hypothetical protein
VRLASENADDPAGFLEGLSDIHDGWHGAFYENVRLPALPLPGGPLFQAHRERPATGAGRAVHGRRASADGCIGARGQPGQRQVVGRGDLAAFSAAVESWRNVAHGVIGRATGTPMMDPRQNIFFRPFWRLHLYIDDLFQVALRRYGESAHPELFLDIPAVAGHIEAAHHSWVPRI